MPGFMIVPKTGVEPARLSTHAPETCASTNSATWASIERKTRLELATPTLARLCSTNWAISAYLSICLATNLSNYIRYMDDYSSELRCKGTAFFWMVQVFSRKNTLMLCFSLSFVGSTGFLLCLGPCVMLPFGYLLDANLCLFQLMISVWWLPNAR